MDSISVLVGILFGAVVLMGIKIMNMYRERNELSKKLNEKLSNAIENTHEDKTNQTDFDHNDSGLLSNVKEKTQTYEDKITQTDFDHAFSGTSFQSEAERSSQNLSDAKFSFGKLNFNFERKLIFLVLFICEVKISLRHLNSVLFQYKNPASQPRSFPTLEHVHFANIT